MGTHLLRLALTLGFLGIAPPGDAAPARGLEPVRDEAALHFEGIPELPERIRALALRYENIRSASFLGWAPGGGLLVVTRFGETDQLHQLSGPGAARQQLTFFDEPVRVGSFGLSEDWLLMNRDSRGNEASQIFRFDRTSGEAEQLTDDGSQNGEPLWSNARTRVAWRSTARNHRDHDLWVMDPIAPEKRRIFLEASGYWLPLDWSPDDTKILVRHYVSARDSTLFVVDVETGAAERLRPSRKTDQDSVAQGDARFGRTSGEVFFTSDEGTEWRSLWRRTASGSIEELTGDLPWDVGSLAISRDRKQLAFRVNEGGRDRLYWINTEDLQRREIPLTAGVLGRFGWSPDASQLAFTWTTPVQPGEVYSASVPELEITRWTQSETGSLDPAGFRPTKLAQIPSGDGSGRRIPVFITRPEGTGPFPVVVRLHGGPESQARPYFSAENQRLTKELGCVVLQPNVRGSRGYGKTYLRLDDGRLRENAVTDVGAVLDWIGSQPDLDPNRVGVVGSSYGGYLTLATLARYPGRVRAGVDSVGISNFVTFLENTADYRRDLRRQEYGDERNPEMRAFLESISPANQVERMRSALLVIQGANDPRVPASEAEQIVARLREASRPVWYLLARNEGHGFRRKENRRVRNAVTLLFLETYLGTD